MTNERHEALQAVVDRVSSYQESAPEGTVVEELRSALDEAGLEASDDEITGLVKAIEDGSTPVDVSDVLS